jgi:S-adenosylmethionine synthetase
MAVQRHRRAIHSGERAVIETLPGPPIAGRRLELVERKGLGHPDTICDSLAEAIALALNRLYLQRLGTILHYNVDKALLIAGQTAKGFGWGDVTRPMEFVVGDRATLEVDGVRLPVEETARDAVEGWFGQHLPLVCPGTQLRTRIALAPGSAQLRTVLRPGDGEILANDTAGASGYAPFSPTEELVLAVERYLNGPEFKAAFPDTGQDVKVLAVRQDDRIALTVAMPFLCRQIASEPAYYERKEAVLATLGARFGSAPFAIDWRLNSLDRTGQGADGVYLTVTGTSAEDADSGQVGRGNRVNGLFAFSRPGGAEAAAGKNPIAHIGKIYSVLSHRLAQLIHARCPALPEVHVHLAARIGDPVDTPWTGVQVVLPPGMGLDEVAHPIRELVAAELARLPVFRSELTMGSYPVC